MAIQTQPFEVTREEYVRTMLAILRRRMFGFDLFAGLLVVVVAFWLVKLPLGQAILLFPFPAVIGFFRMPGRVRRMADHPNSGRPAGRQTFHVDEEGVIYSGGATGPLVLKWDEVRSVRWVADVYVVDAGIEEFLVPPSTFASAQDEKEWQKLAKARVRRHAGF